MSTMLFDKQKLKENPQKELKNQLDDAFEQIGVALSVNRGANKSASNVARVSLKLNDDKFVELTIGGANFRLKNTAVYKNTMEDVFSNDMIKLTPNSIHTKNIYGELSKLLKGEESIYPDMLNDFVNHLHDGKLEPYDYAVFTSMSDYYACSQIYKDENMAGKFIDIKYQALECKFDNISKYENDAIYISYFTDQTKPYGASAISIPAAMDYVMWRDYTSLGMKDLVTTDEAKDLKRSFIDRGISVSNETLAVYLYSKQNAYNNVCNTTSSNESPIDISVPVIEEPYRMHSDVTFFKSKESSTCYVKGAGINGVKTIDKYSVDANRYPILSGMIADGKFTEDVREKLFGKDRLELTIDAMEMACFDYMKKTDLNFGTEVSSIHDAYVNAFLCNNQYDFIMDQNANPNSVVDPVRYMLDSIGVGGRSSLFKIGSLVEPYTLDGYASLSSSGKARCEANADRYHAYVSAMDNIQANADKFIQPLVVKVKDSVIGFENHMDSVLSSPESTREDIQESTSIISDNLIVMTAYDTCTRQDVSKTMELNDNGDLYIPLTVGELNCLKALSQVVHRDLSFKTSMSDFANMSNGNDLSFDDVISNIGRHVKTQVVSGKLQCDSVSVLKNDLESVYNNIHAKFDTPEDMSYGKAVLSILDKIGGGKSALSKSVSDKQTTPGVSPDCP